MDEDTLGKRLLATSDVSTNASEQRSLNCSTASALGWLHSEQEHSDSHIKIALPAGAALVSGEGAPGCAFLSGHAAVLAARSQLWHGQLCSEHFHSTGVPTVMSLGVHEGNNFTVGQHPPRCAQGLDTERIR
jgi:hypothetical protein